MKTTYNDLFFKERILANIPFTNAEMKFSAKLCTAIILMQVALGRKIKEFEDFMHEALEKMKRDGFDKRLQVQNEAADIRARREKAEAWNGTGEKPEMPSEEELRKEKEALVEKADFDKEMEELNAAYADAQKKKSEESVSMDGNTTLSLEEYDMLVATLGVSGKMDFVRTDGESIRIDKSDFLRVVAENFVKIK